MLAVGHSRLDNIAEKSRTLHATEVLHDKTEEAATATKAGRPTRLLSPVWARKIETRRQLPRRRHSHAHVTREASPTTGRPAPRCRVAVSAPSKCKGDVVSRQRPLPSCNTLCDIAAGVPIRPLCSIQMALWHGISANDNDSQNWWKVFTNEHIAVCNSSFPLQVHFYSTLLLQAADILSPLCLHVSHSALEELLDCHTIGSKHTILNALN